MKPYLLFLTFLCLLTYGNAQPQAHVFLGYQQAYLAERNTFSDIGLGIGAELQLSPRWSVSLNAALYDYCLCDLGPYRFSFKGHVHVGLLWGRSSPSQDPPGFTRLYDWTGLGQYHWPLGSNKHHWLILGTGITFRSGADRVFVMGDTEGFVGYYPMRDWAIPIRIQYRWHPAGSRFSLSPYFQYQPTISYEKRDFGKTPQHPVEAAIRIGWKIY